MTRDQYNEWRNHPATLFFRQFLKDRAQYLIQQSNESWLNAPDIFEKDAAEARGRILELLDAQDVPFETIETFYRKDDAEEDSVNTEG